MALTEGAVEAHIAVWEGWLSQPQHIAHRARWPNYLFHHSPLQNAIEILRSGQLRSRNDPNNPHPVDVAAPGVIDARHEAHEFVRLYFRPCTPTQYRIEGIRKAGEAKYGDQSHAPFLVMFVLDARSILTRAGTYFSDRNMQAGGGFGDTPEYFGSIPFAKVYHMGGTSHDMSIIQHRCAEVLAASPMPLSETMQWVYCRSTAERETLIYHLRGLQIDWSRLVISDDLKVFQREYTFVESVRLSSNGLIFQLNPRLDGATVSIELGIWDSADRLVSTFSKSDFPPLPPAALQWRHACVLGPGNYRVRIMLEGHLAYLNELSLDDPLF
ncbi:DarT ssDNA thymidine ADP-ribosyltransferase family protein [Rhizobium binxianense]|uniref:DarT ssDNA thymidine ADP-ribosyltransferase family protein n=1 Tax=Rhizobium binxianense TaxID=3024242 RepID=UPI00234EA6F0|nr:DarT ssDNA thymidine ADP-ribosyltransferase family protein [Rhizobium sp. BC56]MDC7746215.1 DarT ssDNA thymidine ADP-ribosyltransferase family protein [Rhizobium sp. BC56]